MRTYQLTIEVDDGDTEFWKGLVLLSDRDAKVKVRDEIAMWLSISGFPCRVEGISVKRR